jgi:surfactin synthase thioesterase subunit
MKSPQRLILFPGLAADERMYADLQVQDLPMITPRLLIPQRGEIMADYAQRHAEWLDVGEDDIVGGCSFGSMVASEICRQRQARALILLSGALSSATLTASAQRLNNVNRFSTSILPCELMRWFLQRRAFLRLVFGGSDPVHIDLGRVMVQQTPCELLRRGLYLAANYQSQQQLNCAVFALHGLKDRVLLPPAVEHCQLLADAGHGMVVSHAQQVSSFLQDVYQQLARE